MSIIKKLYYAGCSVIPLSMVSSNNVLKPLLPYHHTVSNDVLPHIYQLYKYKNTKQFENDVDLLLKHFQPVSEEQLITCLREQKPFPKRSFLLTFDDGFREVYDNIAPMLERKGVPAVFFINPAFIDNNVLFYRCKISLLIDELVKAKNKLLPAYRKALAMPDADAETVISQLKKINQLNAHLLEEIADETGFSFQNFLKQQQPFLQSKQVINLKARGFTIGAHSIDHPYYPLLSMAEQISQTLRSCAAVNALVQTSSCSFSFPHSDEPLSQDLFNELLQTNIPIFYGIQNQKWELNNRTVHRFNAERPELDFTAQLKGLAVLAWLRNLRGTNNLLRK